MQTFAYHLDGDLKDSSEYYDTTKKLAAQLYCSIVDLFPFLHYFEQDGDLKDTGYIFDYECALYFLLFGALYEWHFSERGVRYSGILDMLEWMEETGEFEEESICLKAWLRTMTEFSADEWRAFWDKIYRHLDWIAAEGKRQLFCYISTLDEYLKQNMNRHFEDDALVLRPSIFYYLNMIGAQYLNRLYRNDFLECKDYYIFLPGCMAEQRQYCRAVKCFDGSQCQACDENCQIQRITKECQPLKTRILYHGSEMNRKKADPNLRIGVVGVACVLNLISGGMKARRLGYIPQCVILDYCGCKKHWDKNGEGLVTSINDEELRLVLKTL